MIAGIWSYLILAAIAALLVGMKPLGRSAAPWLLTLLTILAGFEAFSLYPFAPGPWFDLVYLFAALAPLSLFLLTTWLWDEGTLSAFGFRLTSRQLRTLLPISAGMVGLYLLLTLEPGIALGFLRLPAPTASYFALIFLTTPVLVLGQEAVFRGYFLSKLSEGLPLRTALFLSAALFAVASFNPFLIGVSSGDALASVFFLTVVTSFVVGLFAGIYFYKTGWSLFGPWTARTGLVWSALLVPVTLSRVGWPEEFVFQLLGISAAIVVTYLVIREPRFQGRHYFGEPRALRGRTLVARARARRQLVGAAVALAALLLVAGLIVPPLVRSDSSPYRVLAIASGSMVPTFHVGDLVLASRVTSPDQVHVGDILVYNAPYLSPEGPVVHRLIATHPNGTGLDYIFKGDHNPSRDPRPAHFSQIYGKVLGDAPYVGFMVLSPAFGLSLVALLLLITVYRASTEGMRRRRRRPVLPLRGV